MSNSKKIKLSLGTKENLGKVKNVEMTWHDFCEKLSTPFVDKMTIARYSALTKLAKGSAKAKPGFFLAGHCVDGVRQNSKIEFRSLITLDADDVVDDELYTQIKAGQLEDLEFEAFVYTTRSHTQTAPRFRIVIPLETEITDPDAYAAVARLVASRIDDSMEIWDPCSFRPAQMMYLPSVSSDQEFIAKRMPGNICDPHIILEECDGDWRDISNLPRAQKEIKKLKPSRSSRPRASSGGGVLADPAKKSGVVGAFCRAYSVEEAIEKFIPSVYTYAGDKAGCARYTYTEGSSFGGGAVLGGTHFYSHHATDPANDGSAHNAFDIVRIHKFGHLDEFQSHNISELESHKAMHEFSLKDDKVVANLNTAVSAEDFDVSDDVNEEDDAQEDPMSIFEELLAVSEYTQTDEACAASAFDVITEDDELIDDIEDALSDLTIPADEGSADLVAGGGIFSALAQKVAADSDQDVIDDIDWLSTLERQQKTNKIIKSTYAIAQILANDTRFAGCFAYNQFIQDTVLIRDIDAKISDWKKLEVDDRANGDLVSDRHTSLVIAALSTPEDLGGYGISASDADVTHAISVVSNKNAFHPVRDYLESLQWDGNPRIETMFVDYLGASDNAYTRAVSKMFFKAAVARIFQPGVKFDNAVVLEGIQGIGKSSVFEELSSGWYARIDGRSIKDINKAVEAIHGAWIVEMPELCGIERVDVNIMKEFLDKRSDRARLAYRRNAENFPRQCVIAGTTNKVQYLEDDTGNRRFWPVKCGFESIDMDQIRADRDQLWAEAVQMYREDIQEHGFAKIFIKESEDKEIAKIAKSLQSSRKVLSLRDMLEDEIVDFVSAAKPHSDISDYDSQNMWKEVHDCGETRFICTHLTLQFIWTVILEREPSDYHREAGKFARLVGSIPFLELMDSKRVLPISKSETKRSRGYRVIHEVLK